MTLIQCKKKDGVATLTLNRPDTLNSLNRDLFNQAISTLDELAADTEARVVVLTGQGKAFCAGGDLDTILKLKDAADCHSFIGLAGRMAARIYDFPKPVIAMVNGVAAGAGFNMVLACDVIFASSKARFAQSFIGVGLHPDMGGTYLLPRAVGLHRAKELMFTGKMINAQEAHAMGFVNHVIPENELDEKVSEFANALAQRAPLAIKLIKQCCNRSFESGIDSMLATEVTNQVACWDSQDGKEGIRAFLEKRTPKYSGK